MLVVKTQNPILRGRIEIEELTATLIGLEKKCDQIEYALKPVKKSADLPIITT